MFATRLLRTRKANVNSKSNTRINQFLVFLMVQTFALGRTEKGGKCLNRNTSASRRDRDSLGSAFFAKAPHDASRMRTCFDEHAMKAQLRHRSWHHLYECSSIRFIGERSAMYMTSEALSISSPISIGHVEQGIEIAIAPAAMQENVALVAHVNGALASFAPFHNSAMQIDEHALVEGTNELTVLAILKPGANAQQMTIEITDTATQVADRFVLTPTHDAPDTIELLFES